MLSPEYIHRKAPWSRPTTSYLSSLRAKAEAGTTARFVAGNPTARVVPDHLAAGERVQKTRASQNVLMRVRRLHVGRDRVPDNPRNKPPHSIRPMRPILQTRIQARCLNLGERAPGRKAETMMECAPDRARFWAPFKPPARAPATAMPHAGMPGLARPAQKRARQKRHTPFSGDMNRSRHSL